MKILVTGGAGYLGLNFCQFLLNKKVKVKVADILNYKNDNLSEFIKKKNFQFSNIDVRNFKKTQEFSKDCDAVVHFAGIVGYPACNKNPKEAKSTNILGSKNISLIFKNRPKIYSNTSTIYGNIDSGFCNEETKPNPLTIYSKTKFKGEKHFLDNNGVSLRLSTVFGLSNTMRHDLLIHDFIKQCIKFKKITIYQKSFLRSFLHVEDVSGFIYHLLLKNKASNTNIFNLGDQRFSFSKEDLVKKLKQKIKFKSIFKEIATDLDFRNYEIDFNKVKKTNYKFKANFDKSLDELIDYYTIYKDIN